MMRRKKKPANSSPKKDKIKKIIKSLNEGWHSDERETSILFDYETKKVFLETSYPSTAKRWFDNWWGDPNVVFFEKGATIKIAVPWDYCRSADSIVKAKHRTYNAG